MCKCYITLGISARVHVCVFFVCKYVYVYPCDWVSGCMFMCVFVYMCVFISVFVFVYVCVCLCVCVSFI